MTGFLLDSGVFVMVERKKLSFTGISSTYGADLAIAMVTVAELWTGVLSSRTPEERKKREQFFGDFISPLPAIPYTKDIAFRAAEFEAFSRKAGTPRGERDLDIAATAAVTGRTLLTFDTKARFGLLPGLGVIEL